jgi:UDP-N-acetylmuramoylalanine--D-glutamate ligase
MSSVSSNKNIKKIFDKKKIKILIWGFGATGKSLLRYFSSNFEHKIYVCDKKEVGEKCELFEFVSEDYFLSHYKFYDLIIPSPGIKLPPRLRFSKRVVAELDLFFCFFKGEIIAITGSVGKTSITTFVYEILKENTEKSVYIGGNIGAPVFDILIDGNVNGTAVLEVSDSQLQYTKLFSPDYFLWTNTYKNHLDRHGTFFWYFWAKLRPFYNGLKRIKFAFVDFKTNEHILCKKKFNFDRQKICVYDNFKIEINFLPKFSYLSNWLLISNFLYKYGLDYKKILKSLSCGSVIKIPEHRLEHCGTSRENIDFYNDSKSTIIESTLEAIKYLKNINPNREIVVILGGLSKGVNRVDGIVSVLRLARWAVFFGKESVVYKHLCVDRVKNLIFIDDLCNAFEMAKKFVEKNGIVLFSPGGSSFDLFNSYSDRGIKFKELVRRSIQ